MLLETGLAGCLNTQSTLNSGSEVPFLLKDFISKIFHLIMRARNPHVEDRRCVSSVHGHVYTTTGPRETSQLSSNFFNPVSRHVACYLPTMLISIAVYSMNIYWAVPLGLTL